MLVWPVTCTWATRRQPSSIATSGPTTQYGPIDTPRPIVAPGAIRAVGSIAVIARSYAVDYRADIGLGHDLSGDLGFAAVPPHVLSSGGLGHVIFDGITRKHRLAKFRLVDCEKIDRRSLGLPAQHVHADDAGGLRHALDQ